MNGASSRSLVVVASMSLFGCNDEGLRARTTSPDLPRRETFDAVGNLLLARCGSLDCHGGAARNYRLRGFGSRRLAADTPEEPGTTADELSFDYDTTVSIEPELGRRVAVGETTPDALTLVRKARGTEGHLGGARMPLGSADDRCLTAWLSRREEPETCKRALSPTTDDP